MCCKVTVDKSESELQSDRGRSCKVTVDKSGFPREATQGRAPANPSRGRPVRQGDRGSGG
jgi:hypothetical protein